MTGRVVAAIAIGLVAAVVIAAVGAPSPLIARIQVVEVPLTVNVQAQAGELRSVMVQRVMYQEARTTGPSPDRLRVTFDAPVVILGVLLSVDIDGPALVEFAVGIDPPAPYGLVEPGEGDHREFTARDWLLHASDSNGGRPSKIDEQAWYPGGFPLALGEAVILDAWLGNQLGYRTGVSPEMIVFYRATS